MENENENEWVFFQSIDWNDPKFNKFNIDTRDFHVGYNKQEENHPDYNTLIKYDRFLYTLDELSNIINRLFKESGGKGNWRMLSLESEDDRVTNWNLKYIRIWRSPSGFIICNQLDKAISKELINLPVKQEYLNHQ